MASKGLVGRALGYYYNFAGWRKLGMCDNYLISIIFKSVFLLQCLALVIVSSPLPLLIKYQQYQINNKYTNQFSLNSKLINNIET